MKVTVKLFGLLPRHVPGYDHGKGIVVETREGITYGELISLLNLPAAEVGLLSVGGIMRRPDDPAAEGEEVNIFMPLGGG